MADSWPLVLASASPRREALLRQIGLEFEVRPSEVEERGALLASGGDPVEYVRQAAYQKALAVAAKLERALVIGADTEVILGGQMLGKPQSEQQAREMLSQLSGRTHQVLTGLALVRVGEPPINPMVDHVTTQVTFRVLSAEEIGDYVATGEPMDKAGAYGIQGKGAVLVAGIVGDYANVVGLPLARLAEMLRALGVRLWPRRASG